MNDTEEREPVDEEETFLTLVRERYQLCIEAERDNRVRAKEALEFRDLEQWDQKARNERENEPEGARPCLVVDKLNQHIQQIVNDERQNKPQIKVRPVEGGDAEVAKVFDGLIRHIQDASHADIAFDTGFEAAVDGGFGYWRILSEFCDPMSFSQDLRIKRIRNRFSVYLDPERQEPDGSDAKYGFIFYKVTKKDFKRKFGTKAEEAMSGFGAEGKEFTEWYGDDWVLYAEYFWIEYEKITIVELPDGTVAPKDVLPDGTESLRERETEVPSVRWRKLTATKILEDGAWAGSCIPIVEVVGNELDIEGRVKRSGAIRGAMDAQRVDNYATSAFVEQVALAPRSSYVAALGQLEGQEDQWRTANRRNISVLMYKALSVDGVLVAAPRREAPPGIPTGWLSVLGQAEHNIQAAMGRYNATLGEDSNEKSGRALIAKQREGDVGSFHFSDNLKRSMRHTGQILVEVIPKYYDKPRIARIIGEDGTPGTASIDPGLCDEQGMPCAYAEHKNESGAIEKIYNLNVGKYDVTIVSGPNYTTRRLESADAMMEISRGNNEFLAKFGDIIFKSQDWPGADQIAARFKKMLPPELQDEPEGEDRVGQIERAKAQVQAAAQALGQREAEVNAAHQQAAEAAQAAEEQEAKAKEVLTRVEAQIAKLNETAAGVENDKQLLALQKDLALKEIALERATLEREKAEFESKKALADVNGKLILERMETKLGSLNDAAAVPAEAMQ